MNRQTSSEHLKMQRLMFSRQEKLLGKLSSDLKSMFNEKSLLENEIDRLRSRIDSQNRIIDQYEQENDYARRAVTKMYQRIVEESRRESETIRNIRKAINNLKMEADEKLERDSEVHFLKAKLDQYSADGDKMALPTLQRSEKRGAWKSRAEKKDTDDEERRELLLHVSHRNLTPIRHSFDELPMVKSRLPPSTKQGLQLGKFQ